MATPSIAITTGEPAGIGPDIALMAAQRDWACELVVIADPALLQERAQTLGLPIQLQPWVASEPARAQRAGTLKIHPVAQAVPTIAGTLNPANAAYVIDTLKQATHGCMQGSWQAMVTGPVQKSVINDAGIPFIGHTELLAEETGAPQVVMMLATQELRVALATTHLALKDVPRAITRELLRQTLRIVHLDLQSKFGIGAIPVLEELRAAGIDLLGPLPADTAFNPKVLDNCDAVFAMYHDQGLPVLKYSGFGRAINITLGLPIIRTSVDHGTALDLAGTGTADWHSLEQAIEIACQMSMNRQR